MAIFMFIYYVGIFSCGMQGVSKALLRSYNPTITTISILLTSFGGGLIRDLCLLRVFPAFFMPDCFPDIMVAMTAGILFLNIQLYNCMPTVTKWCITIADASGLGTFIAIGVDKSLGIGAHPAVAFLCGVVTSIGGGISSSLLCGVSFRKALLTNIPYKLIAIIGSAIYTTRNLFRADHLVSQYVIVLYTTFVVLASDQDIVHALCKYAKHARKSSLVTTQIFFIVLPPPYWRFISRQGDSYKASHIHHLQVVKRTLIYHRIQLM